MSARVAIITSVNPDSASHAEAALLKAADLMERGLLVEVFIADADSLSTPNARSDALAALFRLGAAKNCRLRSGVETDPSTDIALLFGWRAARHGTRVTAKSKAIVLSDIEAWHYPMGDDYLAAEAAINCGLPAIVLGKWVGSKLETVFGIDAFTCPIGIDVLPLPSGHAAPISNSICALWNPEDASTCPRLTIEALGIFLHFRPEVELVLISQTPPPAWFPKCSHLTSEFPPARRAVYRSCRAGLAISTVANHRPALEMMACGMPVVNFYRDVNVHDYPKKGIYLADQTAESVAYALSQAVDRAETFDRAGLSAAVAAWTQRDEANLFADHVFRLIAGGQPEEGSLHRMRTAAAPEPLVSAHSVNPRVAYRLAQIDDVHF